MYCPDLDNQTLSSQAGNARQLIIGTLFDLLFSASAAQITQQRLDEIEKSTLKLILNNNVGKDILIPEARALYIQQLHKNGLGMHLWPHLKFLNLSPIQEEV